MNFLRFLFWGLAYSGGITCLAVYFICFLMDKNRFLKNMLLMLVPFLVVITCLFLMEIFDTVYGVIKVALSAITLLASSALIYTIPRFAHTAKSSVIEKVMNPVFAAAATLLSAAIIIVEFIPMKIALKEIVLISLGISIFYSMCVLLFGKASVLLPDRSGRFTRAIAVVCICLLPGFIFLDFFSQQIAFLSRIFPQKPYTLPAFYLFFNIMLLTRVNSSSIKLTIQDNISDNFFKEFRVSKREREIIRELIKGKTYKEIGESLFISFSTARTHVYSIYRKTNVGNKIELIHLLKAYQKR